MSFTPLIPWYLTLIIALAGFGLCWLGWREAKKHGKKLGFSWLRRCGLVALVVLMLIGPAVPTPVVNEYVSSVEIYVVVDRTSSMSATDYNGEEPRLDGVKDDVLALVEAAPTARYSVISYAAMSNQDLPLTVDDIAVRSWVSTLHPELAGRSTGSSLSRPYDLLFRVLEDAATERPESTRLVFFLSDGEPNHDEGLVAYANLNDFIDGGAVFGYGSEEGATMGAYTGEWPLPTDAPLLTDADGNIGISKIDEPSLRALADELGISYAHRTAPDQPVSEYLDGFGGDEQAIEGRTSTIYRLIIWPLALGAALILIWEVWQFGRSIAVNRKETPR